MAQAVAEPRFVTADELLRMPDDGLRRELIDGEIHITAPAGEEHGAVAGNLLAELGHYVRRQRLGQIYTAETGFKISVAPETVLCPDAAFVRRERLDEIKIGKGFRLGAPDLVVEVVSPGDSFGEVEAKVLKWLGAGCRMVIVVSPFRRAASVYRSPTDVVLLTEDDVIDGGDVVPGWTVALKELFV
jgi:Uma2 family endonuclease